MISTVHRVELPVTLQPGRRWSDEELLGFCSDENDNLGMENDAEGEMMLMSPAGTASGGGNADLMIDFGMWARQDGRGKSFDSSTGCKLPDGSTLSPDASWIPWVRWDALTGEQQAGYAPLCPEFVVELLAPTDRIQKTRAKMLRWIANGAELGWLIDPFARTVEVYRPGREPELLAGLETIVAEGPVAGFELDLSRLWAKR